MSWAAGSAGPGMYKVISILTAMAEMLERRSHQLKETRACDAPAAVRGDWPIVGCVLTGSRRASLKRKRLAAGRKETSSRVRVLITSYKYSPLVGSRKKETRAATGTSTKSRLVAVLPHRM